VYKERERERERERDTHTHIDIDIRAELRGDRALDKDVVYYYEPNVE